MDFRRKLNSIVIFLLAIAMTCQAQLFVCVPAGHYKIGKKGYLINPLRKVWVDSFFISPYETTNQQFAAFVAATSYVTDAERKHDALVFRPGLREFEWIEDSTAFWRYPNGISSGGIGEKMDHPVTTISYHDAEAYCRWAGVRLPTLEEWEVACRAGSSTDYFFGRSDDSISKYANVWLGMDHTQADSTDGYMYTSPVGHFAPNSWGLFDMYGNVFEFCSGTVRPDEKESLSHARGGSWWCSSRSCHYFNSFNIGRVNKGASFSNQGFRVAVSNRRSYSLISRLVR
jgi:sulfatase modifying factor 1